MVHKQILTAVAVAALIPAAAFAQRGPGGGHGGPPSGMGGPGNAGGFGLGGPAGMGIGGMNDTMRDMGRLNSQGPANASQTGIDHANQNSVLAGTTSTTTATSGPLAGLTTGTTLYSNGTAVGTVQQIRITGRGSVAMVVVKGANGGLYAVPANKLTYTGGMLSTTVRLAGVNASTTTTVSMSTRGRVNSQGPMRASATGIAHANAHSVLASGSTTALTGVSVGMPLYSNGTQVGSVYRVVTANGVITRVLVQGTNGRIYSLSPSTLTAAGGSVTTSATLRGI
jgi:hypothetical protein